jgi:iron complex transport system substrate-binding protein
MIVNNTKDIELAYSDKKFANINAVKNKKVYATPLGAHIWTNRSSEQPLTVMWAAKKFYPELFSDLDIKQETKDFYKKFCNCELSDEQVEEILSGKL